MNSQNNCFSDEGTYTYSMLKNILLRGYELEKLKNSQFRNKILSNIEKMEEIILKVEEKIKEIQNENDIEKIELINPYILNNSINMEDIIMDHKTALQFNNKPPLF